jgi:diguanylate cyclase (GGDEF)-like protein/PAS domain S-box-containing protein
MASWSSAQGSAWAFYAQSPEQAPLAGPLGLLSRTVEDAAPVWLSELLAEPRFARKAAAVAAGLRTGLAFPVQAGGEMLGVVELLSRRYLEADADLLQSLYFVGRQIGQFLHRKRAESALRESEAHFRALVEQASDSLFVHDIDGRILDVNRHGCATLGYTRDELLRMTIWDIAQELTVRDLRALREQLGTRAPVSMESRYRRKDGTSLAVEISIGPIAIDGQQHLLSLVRDISERQQMEEHIRHLAFHDSLTDLPNRAMFGRYISHAIVQAERYRRSLALLFIDLDRFKNINDTLGHEAGDRLLQEMGRRLKACLREGDLIARMGGDEFVVLVEEVADPAYVAHIARKILGALVREYVLDGQVVHITASIGISLYPQDGRDEKALMRFADIAMYRAKEKGKNGFQFFSSQMNEDGFELLTLEAKLRRALERDELVLHYQPKVELGSGRIVGAEALVRWQHPELGLLPPGRFIGLAEESGLIVPMGQWVLREACRQHRAWIEAGLPPLAMAVNLSARQFMEEGLLPDIAQALDDSGMDARRLELEVTESMVMSNPERTVQLLGALKAMGIVIAIDDFGIGYSSLSHLKRFPFDVLKIDQSFVQDVADDPACAAITQAIIAMSKSLGLTLVAEGVETQAQLLFLQRNQCDQIQGYYFSRPLPADAFAALVRRNAAGQAAPTAYMPT